MYNFARFCVDDDPGERKGRVKSDVADKAGWNLTATKSHTLLVLQ